MTRKILIVSDAWYPQVNGVVTTLAGLKEQLEKRGHEVLVANPSMFRTFKLPKYPEIELAWNVWKLRGIIKKFKPTNIHIATEGTLGMYARNYCERRDIPYTTSYHTNFPDFVHSFTGISPKFVYPFLRWMHKYSRAVLVTTPSMKIKLEEQGFRNLVVWNRAVDTTLYSPAKRGTVYTGFTRPIYLNVGRVSVEKNLPAFLELPLDGTKVVVGDGPAMQDLVEKYPDVVWFGVQKGEDLAEHYASADVFVFPSRTDTFGLVIIEAMASGLPVAAFPVTGPIDIIQNGVNGYTDDNLEKAVEEAKSVSASSARGYVSQNHTWAVFTDVFVDTLVDITL